MASQVMLLVKSLPTNAGDIKRQEFNPWVREILWRRAWQPILVFLPVESLWTEEPLGLQSMNSQSWTQLK